MESSLLSNQSINVNFSTIINSTINGSNLKNDSIFKSIGSFLSWEDSLESRRVLFWVILTVFTIPLTILISLFTIKYLYLKRSNKIGFFEFFIFSLIAFGSTILFEFKIYTEVFLFTAMTGVTLWLAADFLIVGKLTFHLMSRLSGGIMFGTGVFLYFLMIFGAQKAKESWATIFIAYTIAVFFQLGKLLYALFFFERVLDTIFIAAEKNLDQLDSESLIQSNMPIQPTTSNESDSAPEDNTSEIGGNKL